MTASVTEQLETLCTGAVDIIRHDELEARLSLGRPLRVKAGFDPTAPDLHLGHAVLFTKMRQFQDLGHTVIFLIGDFTALIGDPSGRTITRPQVTAEEIGANAGTYAAQVFKILDRERTEMRRNSEWMAGMTAAGLVGLAQQYTVARMLERRDFATRLRENRPIAVHEFLYPIVQGYDSVMLKCDVELGGTDQLFNLTVGRLLQERDGQPPQCVLTVPLLLGLRGEEKMSKSANNHVGLDEPAEQIYAKLMSISDERMWHYYELLSLIGPAEIRKLRDAVEGGANPRDAKDALAHELAARLDSPAAADAARAAFTARFRDHEIPDNIEETSYTLPAGATSVPLGMVMREVGLVKSISQGRRLINQGGVRLDGTRLEQETDCKAGATHLIQVGKRHFHKVTINNETEV